MSEETQYKRFRLDGGCLDCPGCEYCNRPSEDEIERKANHDGGVFDCGSSPEPTAPEHVNQITVGEERNVPTPPEIEKYLLERGGLNPFGKPMFRCLWGWKCTELMWRPANRYLDHNTPHIDWSGEKPEMETGVLLGVTKEPMEVFKYPHALNRFHIERWVPGLMKFDLDGSIRKLSREEWVELTHQTIDGQLYEVLGPYPNEGDYAYVSTVLDVPPTIGAVAIILDNLSERLKETPEETFARVAARHYAIRKYKQQRIAEWKRNIKRAFNGAPNVSYAGLSVPGSERSPS